jgi:hypothetical protein
LEAFATGGGPAAFGCSSVGRYVVERLQRPARWGEEARRLARRLAHLPRLTEAVASGRVGLSMAELIARRATPETEAVMIEAATGKSVRAMREALRVVEEEDEAPTRAVIQTTVDQEDAWFVESARMLIRAVGDTRREDDVWEAMLAEGMTSLLARAPGAGVEVDGEARAAAARIASGREAARRAEVEADTRRASLEEPNTAATELDPLPDGPDRMRALDASMIDAARRLAWAVGL